MKTIENDFIKSLSADIKPDYKKAYALTLSSDCTPEYKAELSDRLKSLGWSKGYTDFLNEYESEKAATSLEVSKRYNRELEKKKREQIVIPEATQQTQLDFILDAKGNPIKNLPNIRIAIENDPELIGRIKFDELKNTIMLFGSVPWEKKCTCRQWVDTDDNYLAEYLSRKYDFNDVKKIETGVNIVAHNNSFNPLIEELRGLEKEYTESLKGSIEALWRDYLGIASSPYNTAVIHLIMQGAISRAFYPACKYDFVLVIHGPQGLGKSDFISHLALYPEWFDDNFDTIQNQQKAAERLNGIWLAELSELRALKSVKDAESIKSFISSRYDNYRDPYSRRTRQHPRTCVFIGTTNSREFLTDKTGNRRFLPIIADPSIKTKSTFDEPEAVAKDFRAAWSEAMYLFHKANEHPILTLPDDIIKIAEQNQTEFTEDDYRIGIIQSKLDEYLKDCDRRGDTAKVCVPWIMFNCFDTAIQDITKVQQREVIEIMDNSIIGWTRLKNNDKGRTYHTRYGKQLTFIPDRDA